MADEDTRFDGLFISALQNSKGIDNFFDSMFSFMRRKTDFFSQDEDSKKVVLKQIDKHLKLFNEDKKRVELIKQKQAEVKAPQPKKEVKKPAKVEDGPTVEEIDEEEARKIELEELHRKQQEDKAAGKLDKKPNAAKKDDDAEEEKNNLQPPNLGNGGQTAKYLWHQSLSEVTCYIPIPDGIKGSHLDVKTGNLDFKVSYKGKPNQEPIVQGKWHKKITSGETIWTIEKEGASSKLCVIVEKHEKQNWWKCLLEGDIEIDTSKVEPENSKLSDLDGETRQTVEKMMFDQQQKQLGKPTSEETEKQDKLKQFMAAHPEMDFSKAKFC